MRIIKSENRKAMLSSAVFLIMIGFVLFLLGYSIENYATAFIGVGFSILSLLAFLFIHQQKILISKIIWGIGTPILLFVAPYFYSLSSPTTIFTYSFLYIAGVLYMAYSFQEEKEKLYMWVSIVLFFIGMLFYDRVIIDKNFSHTDAAHFFKENYFHFKIAQVIHFVNLVYLIILIHKNKSTIELKLSSQIQKLTSFTSSLIRTSKNKLIHSGDLIESLQEILKSTAEVMDVSRLSIWEIDEQSHTLSVVVCYDALTQRYSYSGKLIYQDYPNYFKILLEEKMIVATDVLQDPQTKEFLETYTIPLGIKSMMDSPFFMDGKFKGILCCEEQRSVKEWDEMDQLFSMSISKLISIAYYCNIKKDQFATMEMVNRKMTEINGELANDLLWKEKGIEDLKGFIDEMSFKNAHQVRGPLSRMLGLLHLYQMDQDVSNREKYVGYLEKSARELDDIIKEVTLILNKKNQY